MSETLKGEVIEMRVYSAVILMAMIAGCGGGSVEDDLSFLDRSYVKNASDNEEDVIIINMGGLPDGWGSLGVRYGHPPIFIDLDKVLLVRNTDVLAYTNFHGGMRYKIDLDWILVPFPEKYGGRCHRLLRQP